MKDPRPGDDYCYSNSAREYHRIAGPPERPRPQLVPSQRTERYQAKIELHPVYAEPKSVVERAADFGRDRPVLAALICIGAAFTLGAIVGAWVAW